MGSTPNNANFPDGIPVANPVYFVDIGTGKSSPTPGAAGSSIALASPPTQTNAGSDTTLTFASQIKHWLIQNNTSATAYIELDATASTSSMALAPSTVWRDDIPVTIIHVYTAAAQNVNGATGIVVKGWA